MEKETLHVPRYEELRRKLTERIIAAPPEMEYLPYGRELMVQYGVSRNTVYRALAKLERDGFIRLSRRAGAKILKRTTEAHRPALARTGFSGSFGILLSNSTQDDADRSNIRWHFVNETEQAFRRCGIRTVVYNLREENWTFWTPEKVCDSLAANRITQAAILQPGSPEYNWRTMIELLQQRSVRPLYTFLDIHSLNEAAEYLKPGSLYTMVNTLPILRQTLEQYFCATKWARICFVSNIFQEYFARPRAEVCRRFAAARNIPFFRLTAPSGNRENCRLDRATLEALRAAVSDGAPSLVVTANDRTAMELLENWTPPAACEFLAHDNSPEAERCNVSTIGFNDYARAEALLSLYAETCTDLRGIITGGRFVDRRKIKEPLPCFSI